MQNYIELDDKIIVSNGNISVLENSDISKELVEESNKLEAIEKKITSNEKNYKERKLSLEKSLSIIKITNLLAFTSIAIINGMLFLVNGNSPTTYLNYNALFIVDAAFLNMSGLLALTSIKKEKKLTKMHEEYEEEKAILEKLRLDSFDKVMALQHEKREINDFEVTAYNEKEMLENVIKEFNNINEKEEKEKVKTLGSK